MIDATHDQRRRSWVATANGHADFPVQNLPLCVFSPPGGGPRGGAAIGDQVFDLAAALAEGLFQGEARTAAEAAAGPTLNPLMAASADLRRALRTALSDLLTEGTQGAEAARGLADRLLHAVEACTLHLPASIGDYTDFYAGIHHARNVGELFRPDNPLLPNYKYVPIGYHGRASSIRPSGAQVRRPSGQRKRPDEAAPSFGPCRSLDYELELGLWVGRGSRLGEPVPIHEAAEQLFGVSLLNDWSARDLQAWEYQPLGPFLAKNFITTVSPWVVTMEALEPFRAPQAPRPAGDPAPLPYLWDEADQARGAFDIELEILLLTPQMKAGGRPAHRLSLGTARDLYWTAAQLVAHHASNGCDLRPGDLLGTGTISGPGPDAFGSLLELSRGGKAAIELPDGERRTFLEDGDEVVIRGRCRRDGFAPIGFGECRGRVVAGA